MTVRRDAYAYGLLARWPMLMDESVYRFFQVAGAGVQVTDTEDATRVYVQYEREQVAAALNRAVETMTPFLGFYPRPHWHARPITLLIDRRRPWFRQTLQLPFGHLTAFGQRAATLITADVAIAYNDTNDDGVDDTASLTVTTTVDAGEVQVFYRTADGAPSAAHPNWRVEPLTVTDNGGTVIITGDRALFVNPALWDVPFTSPNYRNKNAGDVNNAGDFVAAVDVYRVYNNTTGAVTIIDDPEWVTPPDNEVVVTADIVDPTLGLFRLRLPVGGTSPSAPRQVRVYVKCGYPETDDGLMHPTLEQAMVHFANTFLVENPVQSSRTRQLFSLDFNPLPAEEFTASQTWHPPQFGVKRGAIQAWDTVKQFRLETLARIPAGDSK